MKKEFSKKGVASFYIVAIATLILVVVAASFATLIINETMRTSNDDLSQSAYDAAMAGVEDAKLAAANYRRCKMNGEVASQPSNSGAVTCPEIMYWVQNSMVNPDCYMVGKILGRVAKNADAENTKDGVFISETNDNGNRLNQAYTCTYFSTSLDDYRADLSSGDPQKVIKAELDTAAKDIHYIKVSWYSNPEGAKLSYANYDYENDKVVFPPANNNGASVPPTISVQLIQTADTFNMDQFKQSDGGMTNRGTVYLVPTDRTPNNPNVLDHETYMYNNKNFVRANALADSNNKRWINKPYLIKCGENSTSEFVCSATIELPNPMYGDRSDKTFMVVVGLPYERPETDISVKFCKTDCTNTNDSIGSSVYAKINDVQIEIDSTGRANDLFRRVVTRLDTSDSGSAAYLFDAIQLLGDGTSLIKNMTVTHQ